MTAFLVSLTGIPPFVGFIAKLFILQADDHRSRAPFSIFLAVVVVVNSVVGAFYYLQRRAHDVDGRAGRDGPHPPRLRARPGDRRASRCSRSSPACMPRALHRLGRRLHAGRRPAAASTAVCERSGVSVGGPSAAVRHAVKISRVVALGVRVVPGSRLRGPRLAQPPGGEVRWRPRRSARCSGGLRVPGGSRGSPGTVDLCAGELVYRDYVYDDYGRTRGRRPASARARSPRRRATSATPRRAQHRRPRRRCRLRIDGDRLEVAAQLNALYKPDQTVVALAIDTDDDQATGGGAWETSAISSKGWEQLHTFDRRRPAPQRDQRAASRCRPATAGGCRRSTARQGRPGDERRVPRRRTSRPRARSPSTPTRRATWARGSRTSRRARCATATSARSARRSTSPTCGNEVTARSRRSGPACTSASTPRTHTVAPGEGITYSNSNDRVKGRGTGGSASAFSQYFDYFAAATSRTASTCPTKPRPARAAVRSTTARTRA